MMRVFRISPLLLILCLVPGWVLAQTQPREGIVRRTPSVHAIVGADVIIAPGETIEGATIIIRDGVIAAVGDSLDIPPDARVWDRSGRTITAGFIDLDYRIDIEEPEDASRAGRGWNRKVHPEHDTAAGLVIEEGAADSHRAGGFVMALVAPGQGIFSGSAVLARMVGGSDRRALLLDGVASVAGLQAGGWGRGGYPGSRMGAVALMRQTLLDARWYRDAWAAHLSHPDQVERPESNLALEALSPVLDGVNLLALRTRDVLELLALEEVLDEFKLTTWYFGSGQEYLWIDEVAATGTPMVIPVDFPSSPTVDGVGGDTGVTLRTLEEWARAPENPERLRRAGVTFALTPRGLSSTREFAANVRTAIGRGFPEDAALAAVTTEPARLLGIEDRFGRVAAGKTAMLSVFDGSPFAEGKSCVEVWIDGERFENKADPAPDIRGNWAVTVGGGDSAVDLTFVLSGGENSPRLSVSWGEDEIRRSKLHRQGQEVGVTLSGGPFGEEGFVRFGGILGADGVIRGDVTGTAVGETFFVAHRTGDAPDGGDDSADNASTGDTVEEARTPPARFARRGQGRRPGGRGFTGGFGRRGGGRSGGGTKVDAKVFEGAIDEEISRPLGAYGQVGEPFSPAAVLIKNATIWTSGPAGTIKNADMLVIDGKIVEVGNNISGTKGSHVIDGRGLHVTPGIIDAHSHTAIRGGVNEGTQAVTAEVRIGDAVDCEDISIYRQLAGGVTSAQLLHGSANPIGGQSALIKFRWGGTPEEMKIDDSPKMIKFALGENVKRSNSGRPSPGRQSEGRYPGSRMGVEQVMRDSFHAARQYSNEWKEWQKSSGWGRRSTKAPPRRDLELETLVEILEGDRLVHCHSYRQDEILMLMRVAEDFDFTIGTFQHILEGYKVAPEMARHGAAGSTFSDWWAYKFEVYDAIPYNGALMHEAGVVVSFNSDSDELARRLNLEAAKAVKYGNVPEAEAFKFVTINPAMQLRLEDRVGSLEAGKDADFAIWSTNPLSTYSMCLQTWIEGVRYFDRSEDEQLRERDNTRREELITILLDAQMGNNRGPRGGQAGEEGSR